MSKYECPNCGGECRQNGQTGGNTPNWQCKSCWWEAIIHIPIPPEHQGENLTRQEAKELAYPNE